MYCFRPPGLSIKSEVSPWKWNPDTPGSKVRWCFPLLVQRDPPWSLSLFCPPQTNGKTRAYHVQLQSNCWTNAERPHGEGVPIVFRRGTFCGLSWFARRDFTDGGTHEEAISDRDVRGK